MSDTSANGIYCLRMLHIKPLGLGIISSAFYSMYNPWLLCPTIIAANIAPHGLRSNCFHWPLCYWWTDENEIIFSCRHTCTLRGTISHIWLHNYVQQTSIQYIHTCMYTTTLATRLVQSFISVQRVVGSCKGLNYQWWQVTAGPA